MFAHLDISKWNVVGFAAFVVWLSWYVVDFSTKSREHYEKVFAEFNEWREKRGVMTINEESKYSMLKATIKVYKNTVIGKYSKLTAYLKSESRGYKQKKSCNIGKSAH
ncbi:hypothetical protein NQ315_012324 [Exocentrus adspersus]|uniref:Uncharacterized protein n=1 Tax=Exocentrus adspersus TaxID=1586481 RepID=A0AAV8VCM7_9CUCU|nr:hypothetical protein NQ315_012324 [Exocentrus adspersus]